MIHNYFSKLNQHHVHVHFEKVGRVTKISGLIVEAKGLDAPLGTLCSIDTGGQTCLLEVIGFNNDITYLMALDQLGPIKPLCEIRSLGHPLQAPVGNALLGRIIDGNGAPIDGKGSLNEQSFRSLRSEPVNPLQRPCLTQPLDVGIRSLNGLIPIAKGQRMGLFAGSGVGKSVLLGMMTKFTKADVVIIGLIGERGREVRDFIDKNMGPVGLAKSVIVASPSDSSPVQRINGALMACSLGEYFREQGKDVLLIMDSLTRFAHAKRQVALSVGEPPAQKGYTPSVFFDMAQLIERAGLVSEKGSMTAFYTVLAEGDDLQDPVVDNARSLLDGHVVLSRQLAEMGVYPAVDVEASISRAMSDIIDSMQLEHILQFKKYHALYQENKDLIMVGAYQKGTNPELDKAIHLHGLMMAFLKQKLDETNDVQAAKNQLAALLSQQALEVSHEQT